MIGGVVVAGFLGWVLSSDIEERVRLAGMFLQLFALGIAARALIGLRKSFHLTAILSETWRLFKLIFVEHPPTIAHLSGVLSLGATLSGTLTVTDAHTTFGKRITKLEGEVVELRKRVEQVKADLARDLQSARDEIGQRLREQGERTALLESRVKDIQVGDWWLEAVGLLWLLVGSIVASVPTSTINRVFHRMPAPVVSWTQ
jgi:hypothetical protein